MPRIVKTTVFTLPELSEEAKEKARDWYREGASDHNWHEFVIDDFATVCAILGIELKTRVIPLMGGGLREAPHVYFRGFWDQGDGACFEGRYAYAKNARRRIEAYAPQDSELHRIAAVLEAAQRRNFYRLCAEIRHRGRYFHEYAMAIDVVRDSVTCQTMTADAEAAVTDALRDLARWLYRQLQREFEYLNSDAVVDEAMVANEYTFTADGHRFG